MPYALVRVGSTGALDNTFNPGGQGFGDISGSHTLGIIHALALQPDGKVLVGGQF